MIINPYIFGGASGNPIFNDVISAYNADGNANDYTGYANGTLTNGATATGTPKVGTNSFEFDGVNDYVDCGVNKWPYDTFSISCWIKWDGGGSANNTIISNLDENILVGWDLLLQKSSSKLFMQIWDNTVSVTNLISNTLISSGTWYHLCFVRVASTSSKLYINGTLDVSNTDSRNPYYLSPYIVSSFIGAYGDNGSAKAHFGGNIDAVQIWNKELTQTDVDTLYNSGNGLQP